AAVHDREVPRRRRAVYGGWIGAGRAMHPADGAVGESLDVEPGGGFGVALEPEADPSGGVSHGSGSLSADESDGGAGGIGGGADEVAAGDLVDVVGDRSAR